jgi:hypothetical protein
MPDCPKVLLNKTYAVVFLALAGRGIEANNTVVGDVTEVEDCAGNVSYQVAFARAKQHTTTSSDRHMAVINGHLKVRTLDAYMATRPSGPVGEVERAKNFFRKISSTAGGKLKTSWTAQNVGKAQNVVAKMLEISYWLQFIGHCWRCTAITFGANAGMSLPQLKAMSGHHSDNVVQVSLLLQCNICKTLTSLPTTLCRATSIGVCLSSFWLPELRRRVGCLARAPRYPASSTRPRPRSRDDERCGHAILAEGKGGSAASPRLRPPLSPQR